MEVPHVGVSVASLVHAEPLTLRHPPQAPDRAGSVSASSRDIDVARSRPPASPADGPRTEGFAAPVTSPAKDVVGHWQRGDATGAATPSLTSGEGAMAADRVLALLPSTPGALYCARLRQSPIRRAEVVARAAMADLAPPA